MIIDAAELAENSTIEADVVIAGGGVAGIALAHQLGNAGLDVAILESGGLTIDTRVQSLYEGEAALSAPDGESKSLEGYLVASRVRCFGGSGLRWGGKCAPLDPMDFEKRDWVAHSGWPLTRDQLQPFYDRACETLQIQKFGGTANAASGMNDPLFAGRSNVLTARPRRYSAVTGAYGEAYEAFRRLASDHPRVRVHLNANVTRIQVNEDGSGVAFLEVRELSGRRHVARGKLYILAMGGVENVRLMLVSNEVHREGVGNHSDWLGRAFQGHTVIAGDAVRSVSLHKTDAELDAYENDRPHVVIGAGDALQRELRSVNFTATLTPAPSAAEAQVASTVRGVAQRLAGAGARTSRSVFLMLEHTPNRDSRVTLTDRRDELGMPRVRLDYRYNALEFDRFEQFVRVLASELGRLGLGRLQWPVQRSHLLAAMQSPSRHHMGATRMSVDARDGVVDEHCRVHGVRNLYVAGSSVFPTSGIANPTLTLLALAHRLGDHVAAALKH